MNIHEALNAAGSQRAAARLLGIPESTLRGRLAKATHFEVSHPPQELLPVSDLIERRIKQFEQKNKAKKAAELINVAVRINGPIAIAHFGDPHLDDDGTDLGLIQEHCNIINHTEGMFAANIGDTTNNWMGRLARLYSEQSTSAKEAWQLCEWFIKEMDWLYFLDGNHGAWSGAGDPVDWMLRNSPGYHGPQSARLNLVFPNRKQVRINARHDFKGHSQWNTAHGPAKAVQMGWRDHVAICGHLHTSGYQILKDPSTGLLSHAIRIASYKTWDRYAEDWGLPNQTVSPNVVTIIRPEFDDNDPRLIHVVHDVAEGAEYLTWLRSKA